MIIGYDGGTVEIGSLKNLDDLKGTVSAEELKGIQRTMDLIGLGMKQMRLFFEKMLGSSCVLTEDRVRLLILWHAQKMAQHNSNIDAKIVELRNEQEKSDSAGLHGRGTSRGGMLPTK